MKQSYQEINNQIRIMNDGFMWQLIDFESAEAHIGSIYELHPDGSESLVLESKELNPDSTYGLEIGRLTMRAPDNCICPKYKKADTIWFMHDNKATKAHVIALSITKNQHGVVHIKYTPDNNLSDKSEDNCYPSKEDLLKSL